VHQHSIGNLESQLCDLLTHFTSLDASIHRVALTVDELSSVVADSVHPNDFADLRSLVQNLHNASEDHRSTLLNLQARVFNSDSGSSSQGTSSSSSHSSSDLSSSLSSTVSSFEERLSRLEAVFEDYSHFKTETTNQLVSLDAQCRSVFEQHQGNVDNLYVQINEVTSSLETLRTQVAQQPSGNSEFSERAAARLTQV